MDCLGRVARSAVGARLNARGASRNRGPAGRGGACVRESTSHVLSTRPFPTGRVSFLNARIDTARGDTLTLFMH